MVYLLKMGGSFHGTPRGSASRDGDFRALVGFHRPSQLFDWDGSKANLNSLGESSWSTSWVQETLYHMFFDLNGLAGKSTGNHNKP